MDKFKEFDMLMQSEEWGDLRSFLDQYCHPINPDHAHFLSWFIWEHFERKVDFYYSEKNGWFYN